MSTITLGVDLAKSVFSVCEMDAAGHVLRRLDLKRDGFVAWLAQLQAGTVVAMQAKHLLSKRIARDHGDCSICSLSAGQAKCSSSATPSKQRKRRGSISISTSDSLAQPVPFPSRKT